MTGAISVPAWLVIATFTLILVQGAALVYFIVKVRSARASIEAMRDKFALQRKNAVEALEKELRGADAKTVARVLDRGFDDI